MPTPSKITISSEITISLNDLTKSELAIAPLSGVACAIAHYRILPQIESHDELAGIQNTAAFICFNDRLVEFVKNSLDARATTMTILFEVIDSAIHIHIKDNGCADALESHEPYDWKTALVTPSKKRNMEDMLGGHHLGLAMCAHFLEQNEGQLSLKKNANSEGAELTLTSSLADSKRSSVLEAGENYMEKMISDLIRFIESFQESPVVTINHIAPGQATINFEQMRLLDLAEAMFPTLNEPDEEYEEVNYTARLQELLDRKYHVQRSIASNCASRRSSVASSVNFFSGFKIPTHDQASRRESVNSVVLGQ